MPPISLGYLFTEDLTKMIRNMKTTEINSTVMHLTLTLLTWLGLKL